MPRKTSSKSSRGRRPARRGRFSGFQRFPRGCKLCKEKVSKIDYKNTMLLHKFITEQGKIIPGRISGNCASHQRQVTRAIKKARAMALLPFVAD